jgi:DEAD/DEAH box helicase domain-containing protein
MEDVRFFGPGLPAALARAEENGLVRQKRDSWYFTGPGFPAGKIGLRSTAGEQFTIVDGETGDIVGTEGAETAFSALHPGAVYLHMGDSYLVTELDLDKRVALVRPFWDTYHTLPRRETDTRIISETLQSTHGPLTLHLGRIAVTSRVVAFQKRKTGSSEVLGTEELDLPSQEFGTEAMWFTIPPELFPTEAELVRLPGAIHAVEHALIALLPLFAMCDRWDIGGLSTPVHSQTEEPTIFIYDGHPGGVGISRQGFERFGEWAAASYRLVRDCSCEAGCPSCVQSPKCGNWNEPLDKEQALRLLGAMR